ncbi:MAG: hypothetical protein QXM64_00850 [Candidatus Aenigmatarchaeota archaeon]
MNKVKSLKDGLENFKRNQILLPISLIYSFILASFLYSFNITLPRLLSLPLIRVFIFLMLLFILFCCAYFFERFLVALMIRISSDKKKNPEKSFEYVERIVGSFIIASLIYLCLGAFSLLASQFLEPIELFIFLIVILIISIKVALYEYAIAIDGAGVIKSFIISWKLTENNWFNIFFLKMFFFIIYILTYLILYFVSKVTLYPINFYLVTFLLTIFLKPWEISTFSIVFKNLKKERKKK